MPAAIPGPIVPLLARRKTGPFTQCSARYTSHSRSPHLASSTMSPSSCQREESAPKLIWMECDAKKVQHKTNNGFIMDVKTLPVLLPFLDLFKNCKGGLHYHSLEPAEPILPCIVVTCLPWPIGLSINASRVWPPRTCTAPL